MLFFYSQSSTYLCSFSQEMGIFVLNQEKQTETGELWNCGSKKQESAGKIRRTDKYEPNNTILSDIRQIIYIFWQVFAFHLFSSDYRKLCLKLKFFWSMTTRLEIIQNPACFQSLRLAGLKVCSMVIRLCFISFLKLQYIASVPLFAPNGQCTNCTNINCKLAHKYTLTVYVSAAVCLRIHHSTPVLCHFPSVSSLYRAIKPCVISQTLPYFTSISFAVTLRFLKMQA